MPLVLSLRSGQDFYVGDERFVVGAIRGSANFDVIADRSGRRHEITDARSTEIMNDVFVSAGDRPQTGLARVAIEAPQDILILRGEKYRGDAEAKVQYLKGGKFK
jgi:hypothetical protein